MAGSTDGCGDIAAVVFEVFTGYTGDRGDDGINGANGLNGRNATNGAPGSGTFTILNSAILPASNTQSVLLNVFPLTFPQMGTFQMILESSLTATGYPGTAQYVGSSGQLAFTRTTAGSAVQIAGNVDTLNSFGGGVYGTISTDGNQESEGYQRYTPNTAGYITDPASYFNKQGNNTLIPYPQFGPVTLRELNKYRAEAITADLPTDGFTDVTPNLQKIIDNLFEIQGGGIVELPPIPCAVRTPLIMHPGIHLKGRSGWIGGAADTFNRYCNNWRAAGNSTDIGRPNNYLTNSINVPFGGTIMLIYTDLSNTPFVMRGAGAMISDMAFLNPNQNLHVGGSFSWANVKQYPPVIQMIGANGMKAYNLVDYNSYVFIAIDGGGSGYLVEDIASQSHATVVRSRVAEHTIRKIYYNNGIIYSGYGAAEANDPDKQAANPALIDVRSAGYLTLDDFRAFGAVSGLRLAGGIYGFNVSNVALDGMFGGYGIDVETFFPDVQQGANEGEPVIMLFNNVHLSKACPLAIRINETRMSRSNGANANTFKFSNCSALGAVELRGNPNITFTGSEFAGSTTLIGGARAGEDQNNQNASLVVRYSNCQFGPSNRFINGGGRNIVTLSNCGLLQSEITLFDKLTGPGDTRVIDRNTSQQINIIIPTGTNLTGGFQAGPYLIPNWSAFGSVRGRQVHVLDVAASSLTSGFWEVSLRDVGGTQSFASKNITPQGSGNGFLYFLFDPATFDFNNSLARWIEGNGYTPIWSALLPGHDTLGDTVDIYALFFRYVPGESITSSPFPFALSVTIATN